MKAGTLLLVISEAISLLHERGFIDETGEFVEAKFNDVTSDVNLAIGVETILKKYGVHTPDKLDKVLQILPLIVAVIK